MVIGFFHVFTVGSMPFTTIGARKTVPSRMARIVRVRAFVHFFQMVLVHSRRVRRDGRAFYGNAVFFSPQGRNLSLPGLRSRLCVPDPDRSTLSLRSMNGRSSSSLIIFQRILVISSPSISTRGSCHLYLIHYSLLSCLMNLFLRDRCVAVSHRVTTGSAQLPVIASPQVLYSKSRTKCKLFDKLLHSFTARRCPGRW